MSPRLGFGLAKNSHSDCVISARFGGELSQWLAIPIHCPTFGTLVGWFILTIASVFSGSAVILFVSITWINHCLVSTLNFVQNGNWLLGRKGRLDQQSILYAYPPAVVWNWSCVNRLRPKPWNNCTWQHGFGMEACALCVLYSIGVVQTTITTHDALWCDFCEYCTTSIYHIYSNSSRPQIIAAPSAVVKLSHDATFMASVCVQVHSDECINSNSQLLSAWKSGRIK